MNLTEEHYRLLKTIRKIGYQKCEHHIRALQLGWCTTHTEQQIANLH